MGLVQMSCAADPQREPGQGGMEDSRGGRARRADRLPAGAVPFAIFLPRGKRRSVRVWPNRFRARPRRRWASLRASWASSSWRRCSSGARRDCITIPRRSSGPTAKSQGCIARCTFPTILCISRSFISLPATSAFAISIRPSGASACWCAGISGIRKRARISALARREHSVLSDRDRLASREKAQYGAAQLDAWRTIQRAHAIANGVYVAAVNRVGYEGLSRDQGLEFWGSSFVADPFGQVIAEARPIAKRSWSPNAIRAASKMCAATGPSCATGASMPMQPILNRWLDRREPDQVKAAEAAPLLRMPAEWEPHEATWLAWPHEKSDWPGKFAPIPWLYGEIVRHLARVERVRILVADADAEQRVRRILRKVPRGPGRRRVSIITPPTAAGLATYCPLFVKNQTGEVAATRLALQRMGEIRQLEAR